MSKHPRSIVSAFAFLTLLGLGSAANALSQAEMDLAAKRAYEASTRDHEEAGKGYAKAKEIAEKVRDTSAEVIKSVVVKKITR